ncbi:MAG: family 10 glycosylhydrolase [Armatimonadetes bacterium]|nr:family 10 glycosylhydrolase [Armatimonadota bacterium]
MALRLSAVILGLTVIVSCVCAEGTRLEGVFAGPETPWRTRFNDGAAPKPVTTEFGPGFEFECDFSLASPDYPRCYWDVEFAPEDLTAYMSFSFRLQVRNAAAVQRLLIYFKSGSGWYLPRGIEAPGEGWNEVVVDRQGGVRVEGQPNGWTAIDGVRLNVFPAQKGTATIQVAGMKLSTERLPRPQPPLFVAPEADRGLQPTSQRNAAGKLLQTRMVLDESGKFITEQDSLLDRITRAGFNAFMPCVWHGRGALYRSDLTVIEPQFAPHFAEGKDPTAELIRKAHANGIEVHPWFCAAYRGKPDAHPEFPTEGVPAGAYDLHDPAYRALIVKEIVEFARRYDVDGINLDYIRTKGISYSEIARAAYEKRFGVSMEETRGAATPEAKQRLLEFQEAAVTELVRGVREGLRQVKPKLILSVCGHPLPKPQLQYEGRNEWLWLERDLIDIAYSMDYGWRPSFYKYEAARATSVAPERMVLMLGNYEHDETGKVVSRNAEQVARLVDYALRKYPTNGVALYWYGSLDEAQIEALRQGPFKEAAVASWVVGR